MGIALAMLGYLRSERPYDHKRGRRLLDKRQSLLI